MNYRREIDGLRAVAVLPVILFHAGFGWFGGGFAGVDVFFVISGYLITTLILTERRAGHFSLTRFYERRARRILPPLFVVMFACIPFAWLWMLPEDMKNFSRSLVHVSLFISNMLFARESGYFDVSAELKPLLHTWSLAIEEQYYVIFPLFILLTWKLGRRWVIGMLLAAAGASLAFAQWKVMGNPAATFYLLPARGWELLLGALVAFYLLDRKPVETPTLAQHAGGILGLLLIAYAVVAFDENIPFPGVYALLPTLGAALIIICTTPRTLVGRLLCSKPLVGIGLISYSAYLWHHPLFAFTRISGIESPSPALLGALTGASLVLAYLSWQYIEKPFRNPAIIQRRQLVICLLIASVACIAIGTAGRITRGYEKHFFSHRLSPAEQETYALIKKHTSGKMEDDMGDDGKCNFWGETIDEKFIRRFESCRKKHDRATIILGDSHALNIYNALYRVKFARFLVGISKPGCRPHDNAPKCPYDGFDKFLASHKADIGTVYFHQSGSYLVRDYLGRTDSPEIFAPGKRYDIHEANIEKTARYLNTLAPSAKIVWLGPFTEARFNFRNLRKATVDGFSVSDKSIEVFNALDGELVQRLAPHNFTYLSLVKTFAITPDFLKQGDCLTYRDTDHFSICGEVIIGRKLKAALLQRSKSR